jgi:hypothetical protein
MILSDKQGGNNEKRGKKNSTHEKHRQVAGCQL